MKKFGIIKIYQYFCNMNERICFLMDSIFSYGGVQRVTAVIAKELAKDNDVTIVTFDKEDAKDIVQSTFVWLMTDGYREQFNAAIWTYWSRKRGLDFIYRWALKYAELNEDTHPGSMGVRCEIDLFHLQKGEKRARYLELWAQGHTPTEIAEMTGSTCGNVGSSVTRSIQFLRKYFRHEKELLRP